MKVLPEMLCKAGKLSAILGEKQLIGHIKKCTKCKINIEVELRAEKLGVNKVKN